MPGVTSSVRDGVCVIEMSNPPVNALALPVLEGLEKALKEAQGDGRVKAIVIKGAGGKFSGGFDIGHLRKSTQGAPASDVGDFNAILCTLAEGGAKPCVAAIEKLGVGWRIGGRHVVRGAGGDPGGAVGASGASVGGHSWVRGDATIAKTGRIGEIAGDDAQEQVDQGGGGAQTWFG